MDSACHVLLVEDDNVTLKTVEALLRKCNYRVTTAANGREAMAILAHSDQKVDLILTDILMPEVCTRLPSATKLGCRAC